MNVEEIKKVLKQADLTENETKVYLALLETGQIQAGVITRKTGLHRRVIYDTLERLINKGLIGYIKKNNIKIFQASNPERILNILKEKTNSVEEIMPELLKFFAQTKEKEQTNFYKGKEGLKTVFEDQIEEGKEILILGASPIAYDILELYFHWFDKRRIKNKIKTKIIFNQSEKVKNKKIPLSEIRYLSEKYSAPFALNIYGEKIAIILWSKENPFAVVIKNKEISEGYKKHFEVMWKISKK